MAPPDPYDFSKKGKFNSGDKGKGKGKNKKGKDNRHSQTPDGKPICYRYNDSNRKCKNKKCRFVHVCSICLAANHPAYACKGQASGADTQGEGAGQ